MRALAPATEFEGDGIRTVVESASSALAGRNAWREIALCGRGGTAEVWHAVAPDGRAAALKRLRPELRRSQPMRDLLRREYALLRRVSSPHLVKPLELVERDLGPELVLELLPNGDLVSLLGAPTRHWLPALRAVVAALSDLHRHGSAHGDVKSRNVLFAVDQSARLIDLTSARAVDAPAARATAAYSVPPGLETTAGAADCFALGVLVYELTTARLPYGPDGPSRGSELCAVEPPAEPAAEQLLAAAAAMLETGGRLPEGLSYFADVIESVCAWNT
jgi:serine/threonine protein kinase